jgi:hypothetical protein
MERRWTAQMVEEGLIQAFRQGSPPVLSPRKGYILRVDGSDHAAQWDLIAATFWTLGQDETIDDRRRRMMLLTWAKCMALKTEQAQETSMREHCRQYGWHWVTFQRSRKVSILRMVRGLNMLGAEASNLMAVVLAKCDKPAPKP